MKRAEAMITMEDILAAMEQTWTCIGHLGALYMLSPLRDAQSAKRFFSQTLAALHTTTPCVIKVDKNAVYPNPSRK
jgi:transposase-like protein